MATASERKALWFFAFVALSGGAVRLWKARAPALAPPSVAALDGQLRRVDSARVARASKTARSKNGKRSPRQEGQETTFPIDLDRASAEELDALPGIGPALAARIVANRDSVGSFGRIEAVCDVRGIGPAMAERLRPLVTFSGAPRPLSVACDGASRTSTNARGARSPKPR